MTVELIALGTYFGEGLELAEVKPFNMADGADLLLKLGDHRKLRGLVLPADAIEALVEIDGIRWWLDKNPSGRGWIVRGRQGSKPHTCPKEAPEAGYRYIP